MEKDNSAKIIVRAGLWFIVAIVAVTLFFSGWYTVSEGFRGVITRQGKVIGVAEPGFGWKIPLIDDVTDMSIQTEKVIWDKGIAFYSKDIQTALAIISVNYRLDVASVAKMYSTVGINYAERILWPIVTRSIETVTGQYTAAEIVSKKEILRSEIQNIVQSTVLASGIIIEQVNIENVDFSDTYEKAAEDAARAEAEVKRTRQELITAQINSQKQVATAEANAESTKLNADADAYSIKIRGEAEAAAIKSRAEALQQNPFLVNLTVAEKWNGELPNTMVPGSTVPFINVDQK